MPGYSPPATGMPDPVVLSTLTDDLCQLLMLSAGSAASNAMLAANRAVFVPIRLSQQHTYTTAWWLNGAVASGNVDVGIYTISGTTATRIAASVAEAQGTISTLQIAASFGPVTIGPGLYYLAMSATSNAATFIRATMGQVSMNRIAGLYSADAASPLPSTITVIGSAVVGFPVFGLSETSLL